MEGAFVGRIEAGFLHGLGKGGVGVRHAGNVFGRGAIFHGHHGFGNEVGSAGTDHVNTKDLVRLLIGQYFDQTIDIHAGARTAKGTHGERADLVGTAFLLELLFGLANGRYFGPCVDNTRDEVVVDVRFLPCDDLGNEGAFFAGLVGKHGTFDNVTDGIDAGRGGLEVGIDRDAAALVNGDAGLVEGEVVGVGSAAHRDQTVVAFQLHFGTFGIIGLEGDGLAFGGHFLHLVAEVELDALSLQHLEELFAQGAIHGGDDAVHELHDRHFGAKAGIDRAEFETDDATAHHDEVLRHFGEFEGLGGGDDALLVDGDERQGGRLGTCGDDGLGGFERLGGAIGLGDGDAGLGGEAAMAGIDIDLVLLHQEVDAACGLIDHVLLAFDHLADVDLGGGDVDAVLLEVVQGVVVVLRRVEECLGRDAAHIEAGATEHGIALDDGGLHAQLGAADGRNITSGAGADHYYIIFCHGYRFFLRRQR
jgi:hypothetical protein